MTLTYNPNEFAPLIGPDGKFLPDVIADATSPPRRVATPQPPRAKPASIVALQPPTTSRPAAPLSLHLAEVVAEETETDWIDGLEDVLEHEVIAVMAGPRGTYKSAVQLHWIMTAALRGTPALLFSAEGKGLARRLRALLIAQADGRDPASIPIHASMKRPNIATPEGRQLVREECRRLGFTRGIILFDTLSKCAAGLDIDSNPKVSECLSGLDTIRAEFKSTVCLVAHTGHSDQGRPKGASSLSQDTDAEYIVSHDAASGVVSVTRQRFKDAPTLPDLCYRPRIVELGYVDKKGAPVTSVAIENTDEKPARKSTRLQKGAARRALVLREFHTLAALGPVTPSQIDDAATIRSGEDRRLIREARNALVKAGLLRLADDGAHIVAANIAHECSAEAMSA